MVEREQIIEEDVVRTPDGQRVTSVAHSTTVVPSERDRRLASVRRTQQIIYFIASAIGVIILLRFILLALGANPASPFASFMYSLSGIFVAPFNALFGEPQFGSSVIEISSLIAIAVYYLIAWGIAKIVTLTAAPSDPTGAAYE
jgi:YggT family protein